MVKGGEGGGSIVLCLIMVVGARMLLYSHISFPFVHFYLQFYALLLCLTDD